MGFAYLTKSPFTEVENHETHSHHHSPRRGNLSRHNSGTPTNQGYQSPGNRRADSWILFNLVHERDVAVAKSLSHVQLFVTLWTVACQAPLSMGFPRQKYWSGLLFPSPGDLADPGIEPASPALAGEFFTTEPPGKPHERDRQGLKMYYKGQWEPFSLFFFLVA